MTRLQEEYPRLARAEVFTEDGRAEPLCRRLADHGYQVSRRPLGDETPTPSETHIAIVDGGADADAALARLRGLRAEADSPVVLYGALVAPARRAEAGIAGADLLLDPAPPAEAIDPWLEVVARRVDALRHPREDRAVLEETVANLSALLENTADYVLFSDDLGNPVFFNAAYAAVMKQMLGLDVRPGFKPHELLPDPADRAMWDGFHRRVLAGERFTFEYSHPHPDTGEVHLEVSYNPVRRGDGAIIGFSEFSRDITQRRVAERALREAHDLLEAKVAARTAELEATNEALRASELRYRGVYEAAPMALVVWDRECHVQSWNQHAERLFGWREDEVLGKGFFEFLIPDEVRPDVEQVVQTMLGGSEPVRSINENVTREGRRLLIEWNTTVFHEADGEATSFLSMGLDITERRHMEERLRHAEKMEAIGQLAGGVAHDFNNQLVAMMGYADLIRRGTPDALSREHAARILQATRRSADLVAKLLTFARRAPQESRPVDLGALVIDVIDLLKHSIEKSIVLKHHVARSSVTLGDAAQLHGALLNLGLNARDAMPGGGALTYRTRVRSLDEQEVLRLSVEIPPGDYVAVSVTDTGEGMEPDVVERIFEPFFTTKADGTGLGLAAAYGAVRSHGGAIEVVSAPGSGTTFTLLLPHAEEEADSRPPPSFEPEPALRARILVVDDETLIRELLLNVLGDLGHEVVVFGNPRRALEHYRTHWADIDLVILDVVMPEIDGILLYEELRSVHPGIRVLFSSGYSVDDRVSKLGGEGVLGLLNKPYTVGEVEQRIGDALTAIHAERR